MNRKHWAAHWGRVQGKVGKGPKLLMGSRWTRAGANGWVNDSGGAGSLDLGSSEALP